MADAELQRVPGRPRAVRQKARDSARYAVARAHREAAALGAGGRARMGELAQVVAGYMVWRGPVLQVARDQGVQDARPRAAVEVPRVYPVQCMRRRALED